MTLRETQYGADESKCSVHRTGVTTCSPNGRCTLAPGCASTGWSILRRTIEILAIDHDAFHLAVAASGDETPGSPLLDPLPTRAADLFADIDT
jgi:hypothetical protein